MYNEMTIMTQSWVDGIEIHSAVPLNIQFHKKSMLK